VKVRNGLSRRVLPNNAPATSATLQFARQPGGTAAFGTATSTGPVKRDEVPAGPRAAGAPKQ
jgi:hypothetical protein